MFWEGHAEHVRPVGFRERAKIIEVVKVLRKKGVSPQEHRGGPGTEELSPSGAMGVEQSSRKESPGPGMVGQGRAVMPGWGRSVGVILGAVALVLGQGLRGEVAAARGALDHHGLSESFHGLPVVLGDVVGGRRASGFR